MRGERWKIVPSYPKYEVSNFGRIRSGWRVGGPRSKRTEPFIMKQAPTATKSKSGKPGYMAVTLCDGRRQRTRAIHQLVLEAFRGPRPSRDHHAAHNDGSRHNNKLSNLAWKTRKENAADSIKHGVQVRGESVVQARLTEQQVLEIRTRHSDGESGVALGLEFGISGAQVARIARGITWRHLPMTVTPRPKNQKPIGYSSYNPNLSKKDHSPQVAPAVLPPMLKMEEVVADVQPSAPAAHSVNKCQTARHDQMPSGCYEPRHALCLDCGRCYSCNNQRMVASR